MRIGCTEGVAAGPGFAVIDRLTRRYPRTVFHVVIGGTAALYRHLAERNIELVMSGITAAVPQEFERESLFEDSLVVAAGLQNPWTRRRRIQLHELTNERWTLLPPDSETGLLVVEAFRASGLELSRASVITLSLDLRNRLLATGRYLTIMAGYTLTAANKYPLLKSLSVELPNVRKMLVIVTIKNRILCPLAELFISTARVIMR